MKKHERLMNEFFEMLDDVIPEEDLTEFSDEFLAKITLNIMAIQEQENIRNELENIGGILAEIRYEIQQK